MKLNIAPLSGGIMLLGLFGFFFGILFLINITLNWGIIVTFIGALIFIASLVSMTKAPSLDELAIDEHIEDRKKRIKTLSHKEYLEEIHKQQKAKPKTKSVRKKTSKKRTVKK